eukprot:TRINITY_DN21_c0_g1_i1.p1 TRINITY_DN21_c0_g1~~TRINITY_DN21_c0_g1_i1.p1  ORF type:complete len:149 (-),score=6.64 TRINITY_DN21_c0_g1_i1:7903-8349(-)
MKTNTQLVLKEADSKNHFLVLNTLCSNYGCLPTNCAQTPIKNCPIYLTTELNNFKVETRVVGNLTHSIPRYRNGVTINNSSDCSGDLVSQKIVFEKEVPELSVNKVTLNNVATAFVQKTENHNMLLTTPCLKSKQTVLKNIEEAKEST